MSNPKHDVPALTLQALQDAIADYARGIDPHAPPVYIVTRDGIAQCVTARGGIPALRPLFATYYHVLDDAKRAARRVTDREHIAAQVELRERHAVEIDTLHDYCTRQHEAMRATLETLLHGQRKEA